MTTPAPPRSLWQRLGRAPLLALLTQGTTPDRIAFTLAVGTACSVFPFLGATTALNVGVGLWLRLNQLLLLGLNYLLTPVQLVMIFAYVRLGEWVWQDADGHFSVAEMLRVFREGSLAGFLQRFGWAGIHAFTSWLLTTPLLVAGLYAALRPALRRLASKPAVGT
ncbi:MAG TPA: DUF2062 domain-containing protein [Lacunisphaera sp.]|nr:DUF2062 domain-containing protein [Lacunisphaera sp.]